MSTRIGICLLLFSFLSAPQAFAKTAEKAASKTNAWPSFRNGYQNSALHPLTVRTLDKSSLKRKLQSFDAGGLIWATAVIDESDSVYLGSSNKNFYSFDKNGKLRWKSAIYDRADSLIDSAAVLAPGNLVVVPGGDGYLHAFDRTTGKQKWDFEAHHVSGKEHQAGSTVNSFEGNVQLGPNGLLYAGSDNGHFYAVDGNGKEAWSFPTQLQIWSSPSFDRDGKWMIFGSLDGYVYLLEPSSGKLFDKVKIGSDVKSSPSIDSENHIYFGASDFVFYSFAVEKNKLVKRWAFKGAKGEIYSSPAIRGDRIVFGSLDGSLYCLKTDGSLVWQYMTHSPVASSPMVTSDGVVLFGAKNGKLYALDIETGERIWSYVTSTSDRKTNLDASVAMSSDGIITVGSYAGVVYRVPYEYCLANKSDPKCEFGGKNDEPTFIRELGQNASTLIYLNRHGRLEFVSKETLAPNDVLTFQLVALKDGNWQMDRAINILGVRVKSTPEASFAVEVSSDGGFLNLMPTSPLAPDTEYHLQFSGTHYRQTTWFWDRFRWFGNQEFRGTFAFKTGPQKTMDWKMLRQGTIGMRSLYLQQPQALDTYIPAALDGQGFLVKPFAINEEKGTFLAYVILALPKGDGFLPVPEPGKIFTMKGFSRGDSFRLEGAVKLSIMGGTIDFKKMIVRGAAPTAKEPQPGSFFNQASCLSLQGNGSGYEFPSRLVNRMCDPYLDLKGVGQLETVYRQSPASLNARAEVVQGSVTVTADAVDSERTVSVVVFKDQDIIDRQVAVLPKNQKSIVVSTKKKGEAAVFLNEQLLSDLRID